MGKLLSIVIPAFNEQDMIPITYRTIKGVMDEAGIPFEIVFVDDGSRDNTYANILKLREDGADEVHAVSFSRNFGKEAAIFAGLSEARGDCLVVMDCDLQHPVEIVPQMYKLWLEGYEVVEGVKSDRGQESALHRGFAKLFYSMISKFSDIDMNDTSDFKLLDRAAVEALLSLPERAPFFRGLSQWIGFKATRIPFEVKEREVGTTKWSTKKLIQYAIHNISVFSSKPLQIVTTLGTIFIVLAIILGIETLYRYFSGNAQEGFTTVISLILLCTGLIMLSLGIIGYYIAQIYDEIKARPRYIVSKRC